MSIKARCFFPDGRSKIMTADEAYAMRKRGDDVGCNYKCIGLKEQCGADMELVGPGPENDAYFRESQRVGAKKHRKSCPEQEKISNRIRHLMSMDVGLINPQSSFDALKKSIERLKLKKPENGHKSFGGDSSQNEPKDNGKKIRYQEKYRAASKMLEIYACTASKDPDSTMANGVLVGDFIINSRSKDWYYSGRKKIDGLHLVVGTSTYTKSAAYSAISEQPWFKKKDSWVLNDPYSTSEDGRVFYVIEFINKSGYAARQLLINANEVHACCLIFSDTWQDKGFIIKGNDRFRIATVKISDVGYIGQLPENFSDAERQPAFDWSLLSDDDF